MTRLSPHARRHGAVLLIVLWMLILLGIVGLSYTFSVRTQLQTAGATGGRVEALWAARAGVEMARATLATAELEMLVEGDLLLNDPERFHQVAVGRAFFSIVTPQVSADDEPMYGLVDEASRLNINDAEDSMVKALPDLPADLADALLDWRDDDDQPRPQGAEVDYYQTLEYPYFPRNGKLTSLRELLGVYGWAGLFNLTQPDPYRRYQSEDARSEEEPLLELDAEQARRILESITVWSSDTAPAPDGEKKLALASAAEGPLRNRVGLTREEAQALIAYRSQKPMKSVLELLDATKPKPGEQNQQSQQNQQNQGGRSGGGQSQSLGSSGGSRGGGQSQSLGSSGGSRGGGQLQPSNSGGSSRGGGGSQNSQSNSNNRGGSQQASGDKIFKLQRVGEIIDYFTADAAGRGSRPPGRINLNTASYDVLMTIPGMTENVANEILTQRLGGALDGGGALARMQGVNEERFRKIYPWVTGHSARFHVWVRGWEPGSGATANVEAVLAPTETDVSIIFWREY